MKINNPTYLDWAQHRDPDGSTAAIVEIMMEENRDAKMNFTRWQRIKYWFGWIPKAQRIGARNGTRTKVVSEPTQTNTRED